MGPIWNGCCPNWGLRGFAHMGPIWDEYGFHGWALSGLAHMWPISDDCGMGRKEFSHLGGTAPPNQKSACFVLYHKIINIFLKKWYMHLIGNCPRNQKNGIKFLVGQAVFKLWIKTIKMLFGSKIEELLGLPKCWCYFWVPWTFYYKMCILFFKKVLIILR